MKCNFSKTIIIIFLASALFSNANAQKRTIAQLIVQGMNQAPAGFKPRYIIYFYNKAITLPNAITDSDGIEKQLDVANWFTVELQEQMLTANFNIVYHVSGGQKQ